MHWCTDSVDLLLALMIDNKTGLGWVGLAGWESSDQVEFGHYIYNSRLVSDCMYECRSSVCLKGDDEEEEELPVCPQLGVAVMSRAHTVLHLLTIFSRD